MCTLWLKYEYCKILGLKPELNRFLKVNVRNSNFHRTILVKNLNDDCNSHLNK